MTEPQVPRPKPGAIVLGIVLLLVAIGCASAPAESATSHEPSTTAARSSGPPGASITAAPSSGTPAPSVLSDNELAALPRGSIAGRVVDAAGHPAGVLGDVEAVGSIAKYEPDGGVGYTVQRDGTFQIPKLAAMTWTIRILDLTKPETDPHYVVATTTAIVRGGQTTQVKIVVGSP